MTEAAQQANNGQARKFTSVPMPPGFSWEQREANIRQYWKDMELAEETAKNTKFNKNITSSASANHGQVSLSDKIEEVSNKQYQEDKTLADQIAKNTQLDKNIKWVDLPCQVKPQTE